MLEKITNQFGIPDKHLETFKSAVATMIACSHFEEIIRNHVPLIKMKKQVIKLKDGQYQVIDVSKKLIQHGTKAIESAKKCNDIINQLFVAKKGQDDVECMNYELSNIFLDIGFLSTKDQEKVKEFVSSLKMK